jgi:hypothetical protein
MELVKWRLTSRISLDIVDLDRAIVETACNHFGVSFARFLAYDEKHRILEWVREKRAKLRGEHFLGKPEPEKLTPHFKVDSRYGKVRADSGARIASR